eukprot:516288_1
MSVEAAERLELKLSDNFLRGSLTVSDCPKCNSMIIRGGQSSIRCICPACTVTGSEFAFCWKCRSELLSSSTGDFCTNPDCELSEWKFREEVLQILQECSTKTIGEVEDVPEYRCCPECGQTTDLQHHQLPSWSVSQQRPR